MLYGQLKNKEPIWKLLLDVFLVYASFPILGIVFGSSFYIVLGGLNEVNDPEVYISHTKEVAGFFAAPLVIFFTIVIGEILLRRRSVALRDIGLRRPKSIGNTLVGGLTLGLILILFWIVIYYFYKALGAFPPVDSYDVIEEDKFRLFYDFVIRNWLISAFFTEILFRGFFMYNFELLFRKFKPAIYLAILFQGVLFIILHRLDAFLFNFQDAVIVSLPLFVSGLILGGSFYYFNRNLWPGIIASGIGNTAYSIWVVLTDSSFYFTATAPY